MELCGGREYGFFICVLPLSAFSPFPALSLFATWRGHFPCHDLYVFQAIFVSGGAAHAPPHMRRNIVLRNASSFVIYHAQAALRHEVSLFRRKAVPSGRFLGVLRNAVSVFIHLAQVVLRRCVSLFRQRQPQPELFLVEFSFIRFQSIFRSYRYEQKNRTKTEEKGRLG